MIAPLDWGLGHATRCIPIIRELINKDCEVFIAANKQIFTLLQKEFPLAIFLPVKGYEITYSRKKNRLFLSLLFQLPRLIKTLIYEKRWLKNAIKKYQFDAVISDNRFNFYNHQIPCIYITHQLNIETGNIFTNFLASAIHGYFIKKYNQCWVPDFEKNGLAGKLSHPKKIPDNVNYIGTLSRFVILKDVEKTGGVLISISGPEPQRTVFEEIVLTQLQTYNGEAILIRGLPATTGQLPFTNQNIRIANHLSSTELNTAIQQSDLVVCRSGYTSVMDLVKLNKQAVFVPTPGQKEQEYLAKFLSEKNYFTWVDQEDFSLKKIISQSHKNPAALPRLDEENYKIVIDEFVRSLKTANFASQ